MSSPVNEVKPSEVVQLKRSRDALCGVIVELQEEIKGLREKLNTGTEQHLAETNKLNAFYEKKVEENEKLKAENEEIQFSLAGMTCDRDQKEEDGDKFYEKNEELKAEIEKLEEELNRYPEGAAGYTGEEFDELVSVKEENDKLKAEIEKLKERKDEAMGLMRKTDEENDYLHKEIKKLKEEIKKLKVSINSDDEDEDLQMVMFEGKEYYVDIYDDDVYDTSHEIVGSWDGKKIIFEEDTENIVKDVVNDIIDEVLDKSLP